MADDDCERLRPFRALRRQSSRLSLRIRGASFDGTFEEKVCCYGSEAGLSMSGLRRVVGMRAIKDAVLVGLRRRAQTDPPRLETAGLGRDFGEEMAKLGW